MSSPKPLLYRKVNTTTHGVHHARGGAYSDERHTKRQVQSEAMRQSMRGPRQRGFDYTPLFKFLLSRIGRRWDVAYAEALRRLDRPDPIFWLVALREHERQPHVRVGESSYYSGLYVDAAGLLQRVDPLIDTSSLVPLCKCCTYTFNGVPFGRPFTGLRESIGLGDADSA